MRNRRNDAFKLKTFRWSLAQNSDPPQRNARHASRPKVKTGRLSGGGEHFAVALYHSDDSRNPRGEGSTPESGRCQARHTVRRLR